MKRLYYGILALLTLAGLAVLAYRLGVGLKATALTSTVVWGLWISVYIYFVGLSAGSFLLSTLIYVFGMRQLERVGKLSLLTAILALVAALLFVWVDLGHPERFWRILVGWHITSIMAWEFALYVFYILLMLVELWFLMRLDLARSAARGGRLARFLCFGFRYPTTTEGCGEAEALALRVARVCGIIGIPTAIGVHGGTGAIFAVAISRPFWNTGLFPIIFLVSALASGAALITFLHALLGRRDAEFLPLLKRLGQLMVLFIGLDMLLLVSEFLVVLYGQVPQHLGPVLELLEGRYAPIFWAAEIGLGVVIPILLVALRGRSPFWLGLAGLSMVVGILGVRVNLVLPAYSQPVLPGLGRAFQDVRFTYQYFPSAAEFAISVGLIALMVLVFSVIWEVLPFREREAA